ncbi:hypothetical protein [Paenibacillus sp. RC67]|uniref:hypothetical protein n=1 Tax=Paenibacillus sp. RC67 TaxID=3039392 RepID=UPI0024ADC74D|nr:hypothetical protein [Paenibacillus sp. RC67]
MDTDFVCHYYWPDDSKQTGERSEKLCEKQQTPVKREWLFGLFGKKDKRPLLRRIK